MKEGLIDLREIWNREDMYEGLSRRDRTVLRNLRYSEWLARSNLFDDIAVGALLEKHGYVEPLEDGDF
ncbi:hypothetical protein [Desulfurobacterium thermolithotrophum]|jgi:hypothetical protein|uniref:hypothetical protein n=1 Tax=Desulfurobacterium thermolithotrophum TaxID=64160 RepID=UPI0013D18787|nr:hypothetical protein [Desulfurobacterium thermolithotrophum]